MILFDAETIVTAGAKFKETMRAEDAAAQRAVEQVGEERLQCLFVLSTSSQRVFLRATDEKEMKEWVSAIQVRLEPLRSSEAFAFGQDEDVLSE